MIINSINNAVLPGGNRGVLAMAADLMKNGEPFALAIVASTQGSTYRKPGALALYSQLGRSQSVISGGCLEPQWHTAAAGVISRNAAVTLSLDTQSDDDLLFGSGSGCRGIMRVMIIPVQPTQPHALYAAIADSQQQGITLHLALLLDQPFCGQGIAWNDRTCRVFSDHADALETLQPVQSGEHQILLRDGSPTTVAVFEVRRAPRVALIGAGVETMYLLQLARSLGWHVTIVDHRPAQLEQFTNYADQTVHARPSEWIDRLDSAFDAVILMSHNASIDLEALRSLATRHEPYVGLLGPPARRDELLAQLTDEQRHVLLPRLHAPLGLRLGGDGPEPLALSMAAELQRCFSQ